MARGTFANIRLRNRLVPQIEGGYTRVLPESEVLSIFDAAQVYQQEGTPLIVIAGKEYRIGSSRDWAAKGPLLLGVQAVIAESYERIHRSNLIGMGIIPLIFQVGENSETLGLTGEELYSITGLQGLKPGGHCLVSAKVPNGAGKSFEVIARVNNAPVLPRIKVGKIMAGVLLDTVKLNITL